MAFLSTTSLLVFIAALLLSLLLYIGEIKSRIVSVAGLCSLLVFLSSIVYIIDMLGSGFSDPSELAKCLALALLMNFYAGIFNVATRVFDRFTNTRNRRAETHEYESKAVLHLTTRHTGGWHV